MSKSTQVTPNTKVEVFPKHVKTMLDKVQHCRTLLYLHGFITEAENVKVLRRIQNWRKDHIEEKK
jgi:hypothetical protein